MARCVIEDKDKIINRLQELAIQNKFGKEDAYEISPENSQYPEGGNEAGGDSTILESQKISFKLCKELKEISENDDLIIKDCNSKPIVQQKQERKSYAIDSNNPHFKVPEPSKIVTHNSSLNDILRKIENDIKRKRKADDIEVFFDDGEESKNESSNLNDQSSGIKISLDTSGNIDKSNNDESNTVNGSISKVNLKKKQNAVDISNFQNKRPKLMETKDSECNVNPIKPQKVIVSRENGWTFKNTKKGANKHKPADAFDIFESSKDASPSPKKEKKQKVDKKAKNEKKSKKQKETNITEIKGYNTRSKDRSAEDDDEGVEEYRISEGEDETKDMRKARTKMIQEQVLNDSEDEEQDCTFISLTEDKNSKDKQQCRDDVEQIEEVNEESQKSQEGGVKKVKYREACRNREERMKKKGQVCERCQKFYEFFGKDGTDMKHACSRHRDDNELMSTPPDLYNTTL